MNQPREWLYDNAVVEQVFQSLKDEGLPEQPPETRGRKPPHWSSTTSKWLTITSGGIRRWAYQSPNMFEAQAAGRRPEETQAWLEGGSDSDGQI